MSFLKEIYFFVKECTSPGDEDMKFISACDRGDLDFCEWLYDRVKCQSTKNNGLCLLCKHGNYEAIKWLFNVSNFTSLALSNAIFELCINEHLEDIDKNKLFLRLSQCNVTIDVIEWAFSICYHPPSSIYEAMCAALGSGNMDTVKWLFLLRTPQHIKNEVLVYSCEHGYIEIAKWFCQKEK